eukprot:6182344-Pyramimonas_sp.AAC.1
MPSGPRQRQRRDPRHVRRRSRGRRRRRPAVAGGSPQRDRPPRDVKKHGWRFSLFSASGGRSRAWGPSGNDSG